VPEKIFIAIQFTVHDRVLGFAGNILAEECRPAIPFAPPNPGLLCGSGKQMLPLHWLALLALGSFLETQVSIWGTVISTENRIPFLWPSVAGNVLSLALSLTLIHTTSLGLGAFVLSPLLAHSLFNYWYWPRYAAHGIQTSWARFMFSRPKGNPSAL
jgi:hypothetical protein